MPVDLSGKDRHTSRRSIGEDDGKRQREQEMRRARGEIACVECQRLKLRCDRKVPCSSCIRRNRSAMCPNGNAWTDQETSTLLSDSAQLHRKLSEMSQRIRQLEDALEISHTANSKAPHPLLRDELLAIKRGVDVSRITGNPTKSPNKDTQGDEDLDALGTLSISDQGASRFIGRLGSGESLMLMGASKLSENQENADPCLENVQRETERDAWLFMPPHANRDGVLHAMEPMMPPFERASSLCETQLECFSWICRVVQRDQLFSELLPAIYKRNNANSHSSAQVFLRDLPDAPQVNLHELALLLMVFATGALLDLTVVPYSDEAEQYYQMAIASLSLTQVLGTSSLAAVQTIALMACYNAHNGRNTTLDVSGSLFNLASSLGVNMGLHRDCARWKVDPKIVERRRSLFWELCSVDCWHNLANGKPPSFVLKYVDVKFPEDRVQSNSEEGESRYGYWTYRHLFNREIAYVVADLHNSVQPIKYSDILEMDRKICDFRVPSHLRIPPEGSSMEADGPLQIMQRLVPQVCRNGLLIYIHRSFFAKALLEMPSDPLRSQYSHSFLAAHRAALSMLKVIRDHYESFPDLISRFWSLWSHAFSATVVVGSIVASCTNMETAHHALVELNLGVALFEKAAERSERAKRSLPALTKLRNKAHQAINRHADQQSSNGTNEPTEIRGSGCVEELLVFGGKTKLLVNDTPTPPTRASSSSSSPMQMNDSTHSAGNSIQPPQMDQRTHSSPFTTEPIPAHEMGYFPMSDQYSMLFNYLSSSVDPETGQGISHTNGQYPAAIMHASMSHPNLMGLSRIAESTPAYTMMYSEAANAPLPDVLQNQFGMGAQDAYTGHATSTNSYGAARDSEHPDSLRNAAWAASQWRDPAVFY